jgi:hypothetical protein
MDEALRRVARRELEQAALLRVESLPGIKPQFLHFHPTLLPYLSTQLSAERRAALEEKYWQRYYALANYLVQADTQTPHQARAIAVREMPNLRRGVDLALAAGEVLYFPVTAWPKRAKRTVQSSALAEGTLTMWAKIAPKTVSGGRLSSFPSSMGLNSLG